MCLWYWNMTVTHIILKVWDRVSCGLKLAKLPSWNKAPWLTSLKGEFRSRTQSLSRCECNQATSLMTLRISISTAFIPLFSPWLYDQGCHDLQDCLLAKLAQMTLARSFPLASRRLFRTCCPALRLYYMQFIVSSFFAQDFTYILKTVRLRRDACDGMLSITCRQTSWIQAHDPCERDVLTLKLGEPVPVRCNWVDSLGHKSLPLSCRRLRSLA